MLTVGDLFSGIGGFSLGLERAGMRTRWFAEVDPFASAILRKHWPGVPNHGDVRFIRGDSVERVDVLCGGFPCQDISHAGKGAGIDGERSGLWSEYARLIGEIRPRYVVVENVAALLGRGMGRVLGDLAALGYDAEWHCIPAAAVGAPHRRDRIWIIAVDTDAIGHAGSGISGDDHRAPGARESEVEERERLRPEPGAMGGAAADPNSWRCKRERIAQHTDKQGAWRHQPNGLGEGGLRDGEDAADARCERPQVPLAGREPAIALPRGVGANRPLAVDIARLLGRDDAGAYWRDGPTESPIRGVDDGVPPRLDRGRLACLGNAVVPHIVEIIGRAIVEREMRRAA